MAYVSGVAGTIDALLDDFKYALLSNGWAVSGNVVSKGASFFQFSRALSFIYLQGGLDSGFSNPSPKCRIGGGFITYPIAYEFHIFDNPDEVYMVINYDQVYYQQLSFGTSDVGGAGGYPWLSAALNAPATPVETTNRINIVTTSLSSLYCNPYNTQSASYTSNAFGLFVYAAGSPDNGSSYYYSALPTPKWCVSSESQGSAGYVAGLLAASPSVLNGAAPLLPIKAMRDMGSNGFSTAVNLRNARLCRIDNVEPGELLTYGSEKWKVYPWLRKNSTMRNGFNGATSAVTPVDHSGTFGYAVRYSGA